jgi:hypothetical protein
MHGVPLWLAGLPFIFHPPKSCDGRHEQRPAGGLQHTNIQHCGLKGCGLKAAPVPTSNAPMPMQASDQQAPVSVSPTASQLPPASTQPPLPSQQTGISYPSFGHTSSHSPRHIQLEIPLATPSVSVHRPSGSQAQPFTTPPSMSQHALSDQQVRSRHHRHSHG